MLNVVASANNHDRTKDTLPSEPTCDTGKRTIANHTTVKDLAKKCPSGEGDGTLPIEPIH